MAENEENIIMSLLPKGLILLALGGYITDGAPEKAKQVHDKLMNYMIKGDVGIMVNNGRLIFIKIKRNKTLWQKTKTFLKLKA